MQHARWTGLAVLGVICFGLGAWGTESKEPSGVSPDEAIQRLEKGNQRFVAEPSRAKERAALVQGQHPYAVVLSCADSRVSPEILFDEALGKLFVIRVAGNVVDTDVLGSIEYAVEHLHAHLLVVIGHDKCGAVQATLDGGTLPPDIAALTSHIAPAVASAKSKGLDAEGTMNAAVRENALLQSRQATEKSALLADFVKTNQLRILAGVYHLDSGTVEWLTPTAKSGEK